MLAIYHFRNTKDFLRVAWEEKKKVNPSFSLRAWAQQMGFKSHNSLYQVIQGSRSMPKSFIPKLKESLRLTSKEMRYLEALVDLEKAKDFAEKELYLERLQKLSPIKKMDDFSEVQNYQFFRDPVKAAIAELALSEGFKPNADWIQSRLVMKTNLNDINRALECLKHLEILVEDDQGKLVRKDVRLASTNDVKSVALQEYHQKLCTIAGEQVSKQEVDKREYHGFVFNIETEKLLAAKERIREFIKEFSKDFEATPGQKSETYCMQNNLFSLTKHN